MKRNCKREFGLTQGLAPIKALIIIGFRGHKGTNSGSLDHPQTHQGPFSSAESERIRGIFFTPVA